jgi:hypothetical protein
VSPAFEPAIPVLRIFDVPKARDFYEGFLGFAWDWEHRFEPGLPAFVQVSRGAPGIEDRPWGWRDMEVADPFGNRLVFSERMEGCD